MLEIHCPEEMRAEIAFAREEGALDALKKKLRYLSHYGEDSFGPVVAHIYHDFADHTFGFSIVRASDDRPIRGMIGGLHYWPEEKQWGVHT